MPLPFPFTERTLKRTLPVSLVIFFVILVNLTMMYRYIPYKPDDKAPIDETKPKIPYNPPYYNLTLVRPKEKKYTSPVIEQFLKSVGDSMNDRDLYTLLRNCLPNTLDTTVEWFNKDKIDPRTFLITGDIPAMWIRDSTNQISPYLRFAKQDEDLKDLIFGVIQVQADYLHYDPYANAFLRPWYAPTKDDRKGSTTDHVVPSYDPDIVWESKYELDSIGHFFQLTNDYIEATGDIERVITSKDWLNAIPRIFQVLKDQSEDTWPTNNKVLKVFGDKKTKGPTPVPLNHGYRFQRYTDRPTETLGEFGIGGITRKCGLIRSAFRPSDDATIFPYLIPSNAQLSVQLIRLSSHVNLYLDQQIHANLTINSDHFEIMKSSRDLGEAIRQAIYENAIVTHPIFGQVFAFEVDCYGSKNVMDDANTPSLLSLPILGFISKNDTIYRNTRDMILSEYNPWYFKGSFAKGIGGPHTGQNMVWPMSLLMQIQTSISEQEVINLIDILKRMAKRTGNLMCESFNVDNPRQFTRDWFSWANGLAGSTILHIMEEYPHLA